MNTIERLGALLVAMAIAGCAGTPDGASGSLPQRATPWNARPQHRSWIDLGVAKQDLLYVSNANGEVTVYRYWKHTLVGVLTNLVQPKGECVDSAGNVFIADYGTEKIVEYAHGGTKPFKQLDDSPYSPVACAVDPVTGNLAVANNYAAKRGNIAVWPRASGQHTIYTDRKIRQFQACAYDDAGNLLASGYPYVASTPFAWLPTGSTNFVSVQVPGPEASWKWGDVGGIQWDGKYFAIDDYSIYRVALIHGQFYYVGDTQLSFDGTPGPYWIYNNKPGTQGTQIVGGDQTSNSSSVYYWNYPAGGSVLYSLTHGIDDPTGVTISYKKH